jgi:hypothetical protein
VLTGYMLGQFFEPALPGAAPWFGIVGGALVVLVLGVVGVLDVAALASAAPPPAISPVTARLAIRGFMRFMWFTSFGPSSEGASPTNLGNP